MRGRKWIVCISMSLAGAACSDKPKTDVVAEQATPVTPVQTASSQAAGGGNCQATGLWAVCSVEKRLKQSGFVAQKNDSTVAKRAGLSVDPVAYTLNRSRLELYLYPDAAALQRDLAKIDTASIAPVFIRSANLAALLFTDDATQAERLALALTAGPPQAQR